MEKQIRSIAFRFENIEGVVIPAQYIGEFHVSKIRTVKKSDGSDHFAVDEIFFEVLNDINESDIVSDDGEKALKRIEKFDDIIGFSIEYEDGEEIDYSVYWEGGYESNNCQTSYLSEKGNLYVLIGKDLRLEEFVSAEILQDPLIHKKLNPWDEGIIRNGIDLDKSNIQKYVESVVLCFGELEDLNSDSPDAYHEFIQIPAQYIGGLHFGKVQKGGKGNYYSGEVFFEILSEVKEMGDHLFSSSGRGPVIDRIFTYGDIIHIIINYKDGNRYGFKVQWEGEKKFIARSIVCKRNNCQTSYLSEKGDLYVLIGKDLRLEEYVSEKTIQDRFVKDLSNQRTLCEQMSEKWYQKTWRSHDVNIIRSFIESMEKELREFKEDSSISWDEERLQDITTRLRSACLSSLALQDEDLVQRSHRLIIDWVSYSSTLPLSQSIEMLQMLANLLEEMSNSIDEIIKTKSQ